MTLSPKSDVRPVTNRKFPVVPSIIDSGDPTGKGEPGSPERSSV